MRLARALDQQWEKALAARAPAQFTPVSMITTAENTTLATSGDAVRPRDDRGFCHRVSAFLKWPFSSRSKPSITVTFGRFMAKAVTTTPSTKHAMPNANGSSGVNLPP